MEMGLTIIQIILDFTILLIVVGLLKLSLDRYLKIINAPAVKNRKKKRMQEVLYISMCFIVLIIITVEFSRDIYTLTSY